MCRVSWALTHCCCRGRWVAGGRNCVSSGTGNGDGGQGAVAGELGSWRGEDSHQCAILVDLALLPWSVAKTSLSPPVSLAPVMGAVEHIRESDVGSCKDP